MKYKMDETGKFILADEQGLPLVETEDGKEFGLDGVDLYKKIPTLQNEAKTGREKIQKLQATLEQFQGIEDPEAALAAMKTVQNLKDKELVAANEVEKIKQRVSEAYEGQLKDTKAGYEKALQQRDEQIAKAQDDLFDAMVTSQFSKSDFFTGPEPKTRLTPEIGRAYFGKNFKVEDDGLGNKVVVGYYSNGEKIVSQKNPLKVPTFEEAIGAIIETHPDRERILELSSGAGAKKGRASALAGPRQVRSNDYATIESNLDKIAAGELTVVEAA